MTIKTIQVGKIFQLYHNPLRGLSLALTDRVGKLVLSSVTASAEDFSDQLMALQLASFPICPHRNVVTYRNAFWEILERLSDNGNLWQTSSIGRP